MKFKRQYTPHNPHNNGKTLLMQDIGVPIALTALAMLNIIG
ncbi:MAG: hypothetical protein ABFC12_04555 [Methanobacterium sp.]